MSYENKKIEFINSFIYLMKSNHICYRILLGILCCLFATGVIANDRLVSGKATIRVNACPANQFSLSFSFDGIDIPTLDPQNPISLEVKGKKLSGKYSSCEFVNDSLICNGLIITPRGSEIAVKDKYFSKGNGRFELKRKLDFKTAKNLDAYFNSLFGFITDSSALRLTKNEYFIPGVWYKGNFTAAGNLPAGTPQSNDKYHYYREDRITLPLVMFRNPANGLTVSIIHEDSPNETVSHDGLGIPINEHYQYGSLGIKRENDTIYTTFLYPGSEHERKGGSGYRYHPVKKGIKHEYKLEFAFSTTPDYASGVKTTWNRAFDLYNPPIYPVNITNTYDGLIETLLNYYVPDRTMGGIRDAAGFPFEVDLTTFQPKGIDYQMGFVGMQIATGYYLYREGIEKNDMSTKEKGAAVLNFWATKSLTSLGFPRTWYDPGLNGNNGTFRPGSDIRVCTGGMEGLIAAWSFAKLNGIDNPAWIDACKKFGNWLVSNQNSDGSYYFSYNQSSIVNGKHPASNYNKYLTACTVRYLVELYIATGIEAYKTAALNAGEYAYKNIHEKYIYVACVVDNPQTIDSESGQMALNAFLSLYDLTKENKWLDAAEQAATYTESWVFCNEVPVEKDYTGNTAFPKDRSIIGQHLIAVGNPAADLGFAWSSFAFYRLYLETGNEHYLKVARIAAHNTKQSMNWDGSLYPGKPKGLQLEAFRVMIPRRQSGILTTLNWNYAAHLDPMFRMKDAFGTPDLEIVEQMPWEERIRLNKLYAKTQSANYGQQTGTDITPSANDRIKIYPNPLPLGQKQLHIELPDKISEDFNIFIFNTTGKNVFTQRIINPELKTEVGNLGNLPAGIYWLQVSDKGFIKSDKLIIK